MTVLVANKTWNTNGEMMADVAELYLDLSKDRVLDPTYGEGGFWTHCRPTKLVGSDIVIEKSPCGVSVDYTALTTHFLPGSFDKVVFDPDYVSVGGRETSTLTDMPGAYGMHMTEKTPAKQWSNKILPGIVSCWEVLAPGGLLMVKGMNYISSAKFQNFQRRISSALIDGKTFRSVDPKAKGMVEVDQFVLNRTAGGPQPGGRTKKCPVCKGAGFFGAREREDPCLRCDHTGSLPSIQSHARNNVSYLIIGRKK